KKKKWRRAISIWRDFLDRYPESRSADEILYHIGLSYQHLGDEQKAKALFDELKTRFPQSRFSTLVR
ncbi:MAG: tetratricopeptide repeat protein, partial [Candidatus Aminicenantes bacterium]